MKKIGILTFHWGANHGAVLQAYATMKYLNDMGAEAFIIDYCAKNHELTIRNSFKSLRPSTVYQNLVHLKKNKKLDLFRKKLNSTRRYKNNQELISAPPEADVYITGSDQVWNPYYLLHGEGKTTPVYFLNFGEKQCRKVAMSVSFGCAEYTQEAIEAAKPFVEKFDAVSVREKSGLDILNQLQFSTGILTADPTSLLSKQQYMVLCKDVKAQKPFLTKCILRKQSKENKKKIRRVINHFPNLNVNNILNKSMGEWLSGIRDGQCVITNSFHCVMLCLKFHTPFYAILEDGELVGMNDRLVTLLTTFGLQDRICSADEDLCWNDEKEIDWDQIDKRMECYSASLKSFLDAHVIN